MRSLLTLVAVALIAAACGVPETTATTTTQAGPETTSGDSGLQELAEARQRWSDSALDTYRFEFEDDCGECDPFMRRPREVVVWDGEATALHHPTVEALFRQVESAIQDGETVEVSYHPESGHPTEISIDMEARAYDGGTHLLVRDLEPGLPGDDVSLAALEDARSLWDRNRPAAYEFRTSIGCDCPLAGSIWAHVEGERIIDWTVVFDDGTGASVSAITVDQMFDDLHLMLSSAEGVVDSGVRFTGSAEYDSDLGYPRWVGLDIEIVDPTSELAYLPPRLVFSVEEVVPIEATGQSAEPSDLRHARALWEEAGYTDYEYQLTVHDIVEASFSDPYTVTVRDGEVESITSSGQPVSVIEAPALPVDGLFDLIDAQIEQGAIVDALYHEGLGYPVLLIVQDKGASEVSVTISIHELAPLS